MYLQKGISINRYLEKKIIFVGVLKVTDEKKEQDPHRDSNPSQVTDSEHLYQACEGCNNNNFLRIWTVYCMRCTPMENLSIRKQKNVSIVHITRYLSNRKSSGNRSGSAKLSRIRIRPGPKEIPNISLFKGPLSLSRDWLFFLKV